MIKKRRAQRVKWIYLFLGILFIAFSLYRLYSNYSFEPIKTGVPFVLGIILIVLYLTLNTFDKKLQSKWNRYETLIDFQGSTNLDELAAQCGKSYKRVCRDIQHMIDAKEFGEYYGKNGAYIDYEEHYLIMLENGRPKEPLYSVKEQEYESNEEDYTTQCIGYIESAINEIRSRNNKYLTDNNVINNLESMKESLVNIQSKTEKYIELQHNPDIIKFYSFHLPYVMDSIENYLDETSSEKTIREINDVFDVSSKAFMKIDNILSERMDRESMKKVEILKTAFEGRELFR